MTQILCWHIKMCFISNLQGNICWKLSRLTRYKFIKRSWKDGLPFFNTDFIFHFAFGSFPLLPITSPHLSACHCYSLFSLHVVTLFLLSSWCLNSTVITRESNKERQNISYSHSIVSVGASSSASCGLQFILSSR